MQITADYSKEQYISDLDRFPLEMIWGAILSFLRTNGETDFLKVDSLGDLYELGLSVKDKFSKKESGVYYTPKDVSDLMADFYMDFLVYGANICDVCAGTGNLIMSVLARMNPRQRTKYLKEGRIYLYDNDPLALKIAVNRIGFTYGYQYIYPLHVITGDFLDTAVALPEHSVVISNPPYSRISNVQETWEQTPLMRASKEYYGVFMEKCIKQAQAFVFITPYSFIHGTKFFELRKLLNDTCSHVFAFDNVPGNIFNGKKHGIFNSNNANATRAAITVSDMRKSDGVMVTPMIRFLTAERSKILSRPLLEKLFEGNVYQRVSEENTLYFKCFPEYLDTFMKWRSFEQKFGDLLSKEPTPHRLDMPTTCRYFTAATMRTLRRDGKYVLYFKSEDMKYYAYILLNSSFAYWYWRIYDGSISFTQSLLETMPVNFDTLDEDALYRIRNMGNSLARGEVSHMVFKKNASKIQQNVKFSDVQRDILNEMLCDLFGFDRMDFRRIHSPSFFNYKGDEDKGES